MMHKSPSFRTGALALACAMAFAAAEPAQAVNFNARGPGQVLLYPYYTVNGGQQTLVTVVNTTNRAKALRVHFREARNGKAAIWFNLYLGAYDEWTAAVYANEATGPAQIVSNDTSCTVPRIQGAAPIPFRNYAYTGASSDGGGGALERTRDGYIEVIDMGSLQTGTGPLQLAEEVAHGANGAAPNCAAVFDALTPGSFVGNWVDNPAQNIDLPGGGLIGDGQIVDVANGTMVAYRATALANFYTNAAAPGGLHRALASEHPDLRDADSGGGIATAWVQRADGSSVREDYLASAGTPDAVSLVLMQSAVSNTYSIESYLDAATDWVISFPTKRYYTDVSSDAQVRAPFTEAFGDDGYAIEVIRMNFYDREQRYYDPQLFCEIACSPPPPQYGLGASANVLAIAPPGNATATRVLKARLGQSGSSAPGYADDGFRPAGWMTLVFDNRRTPGSDHTMVGPTSGIRYAGLPVIGFAAISYINSNAQPGLLANYAGGVAHALIPPIETAPASTQSD
jgi:hypothetical protein